MKQKKPVSFVLVLPSDINSKCLYRDASSTEFSYENSHATHITLCYKPTQEQREFFKGKIGQVVEVTFGRLFYNDKCMAYEVNIPKTLYFGDSKPHVTVKTAMGIAPSYSNVLLSGDIVVKSKCGFLTEGTIAYCQVAALVYGREGKEYRTSVTGLKL